MCRPDKEVELIHAVRAATREHLPGVKKDLMPPKGWFCMYERLAFSAKIYYSVDKFDLITTFTRMNDFKCSLVKCAPHDLEERSDVNCFPTQVHAFSLPFSTRQPLPSCAW